MDNVQNAVNPLSGRTAHDTWTQTIQSTANLLINKSRHCILFTPTRIHHNTRSLYPLDISYKRQLAFLLASEYYVNLWSDVQCLSTAMKMARS